MFGICKDMINRPNTFRTSSYTGNEFFKGRHRFEHWYRDKTVYFITSKVRNGLHAFAGEQAKAIFWDRFNHYTKHYRFIPWVTTLLDNHYHTIGYVEIGTNLGLMMQRIHGSTAKLANDLLPKRHLPFWRTAGNRDYFDGCIRDETQARRAYRYTLLQAVRAGIVRDYREYVHTRVNIELDRAVRRALELRAFLEKVPYTRYDAKRRGSLSYHATHRSR
jgi:hypothetical protein